MYEAAEQQLAIVHRKTQRLGEALQHQIDSLKHLRTERLRAHEEMDALRRQLHTAETRAAAADRQHDEAEQSLRRTAEEFAATQLLQKRYTNTMAELEGRQRCLVRVAGATPTRSGADAMQGSLSNPCMTESMRTAPHTASPSFAKPETCTPTGSVCPRAALAVTDAYTIVDLERRRSFVVDFAYTVPPTRLRGDGRSSSPSPTSSSAPLAIPDAALAEAMGMERVLTDVLSGINTVFLSFGPAGGGKTEVLFGTKAAAVACRERSRRRSTWRDVNTETNSNTANNTHTMGLLTLFLNGLFDSLATQSVTHFSMHCSFAELAVNQCVDLLLQPHTPREGRRRMPSFSADAAHTMSMGAPHWTEIGVELRRVPIHSAAEAQHLFADGMERMGRWRRQTTLRGREETIHADLTHPRNASHAIFSITVESFNAKGHYRRAVVSFVDLCGAHSRSAKGTLTLEERWVEDSMRVVCDAIAATSSHAQTNQSGPTNAGVGGRTGRPKPALAEGVTEVFDALSMTHTNLLARFLRPVFGGNAKAVMVCCVDTERHTREEVLNALSYAYFFKSIPHQAVPYDIPPELQRLNLQMNAFFANDEEDEEMEEEEEDAKGVCVCEE